MMMRTERVLSGLMATTTLGVLVAILYVGVVACTPQQRAILKGVLDVIEHVCLDGDSVDGCLAKAQSARAAERAGAAAKVDAGAPDGGK